MLYITSPEDYDEEVRDFYERHCQNHSYMMAAFYRGYEDLWSDPVAIAQLVYLEINSKGERNILNRLIRRFHRLAADADVEEILEGV